MGLLWNNSKIAESAKFYVERYQVIGESNNIYYFRDKESKTLVGVTYDSVLGLVALYSKYSLGAKAAAGLSISGSKIDDFEKIFNERSK